MSKEIKEMIAETVEFLKNAFCIDGECSYEKAIIINNIGLGLFKLTDSKRGIFYVALGTAVKDV